MFLGRDTREQTEISFTLDVQPYYDFSLDLRPQRVTGKLASHTLSITNTGNVELPIKLNGEDAEGLCRFSFDPESPKVTPRATSEVAVTVSGKRPLRGAPKAYQYTITGSPPEGTADPITVSGSLEAIARMPSWILRAVAVTILLIVVVGVVYWQFLYEPPVTVESFAVTPNRILLSEGESIQLAASTLDQDGTPVPLENQRISWSSTKENVVAMLTATETLVAVIEVESSTIDVQARRTGEAVIRAVLLD